MIPACPPSRVKAFLSWLLPPSSEPIPLAAAPLAAKVKAKPAAQPYSVPRCSRQARPNGSYGHREARPTRRRAPGRSGSRPAPWSLSTTRTYAPAVAAAVSASGRASTHHRSSV